MIAVVEAIVAVAVLMTIFGYCYAVGEHGSELLEEMGYSADEIALLREQGVLK